MAYICIENNKTKVFFHQVDKTILRNPPFIKNTHLSLATYFRILSPDLLPKEITKALYLDSDTLILKNIDELFNSDALNILFKDTPIIPILWFSFLFYIYKIYIKINKTGKIEEFISKINKYLDLDLDKDNNKFNYYKSELDWYNDLVIPDTFYSYKKT